MKISVTFNKWTYFSLSGYIFYYRYPSLRVAYIDEVEQRHEDRLKKLNGKVNYFSVLVRAVPKSSDSSEPVQNLDQVMLDLV